MIGVIFREISPLSLTKGTIPIMMPLSRLLVVTVKVVTGGVLVVVVVWIFEIKVVSCPTLKIDVCPFIILTRGLDSILVSP